MKYLVLRPCLCKMGYVGADGHTCPRCEGNLEYEIEVKEVRTGDRILKTIPSDPDYSDPVV